MQLIKLGQGGGAVVRHRHVVAFLDQIQAQQLADVLVVVHDQNFFVSHTLNFLPVVGKTHYTHLIIPHKYEKKKNRFTFLC